MREGRQPSLSIFRGCNGPPHKKAAQVSPHRFQLDREVEGPELLDLLDVPPEDVEVIFVNRTAFPMHHAIIRPGDRVALAPPGVPGPHRLLLGFKNKERVAEKDKVSSR